MDGMAGCDDPEDGVTHERLALNRGGHGWEAGSRADWDRNWAGEPGTNGSQSSGNCRTNGLRSIQDWATGRFYEGAVVSKERRR